MTTVDALAPTSFRSLEAIVPGAVVDVARRYAEHAVAPNTTRAYAGDWAHYTSWCWGRGVAPLPPSHQLIGLYIAECAAPQDGRVGLSVATIERRLAGLTWAFRRRGLAFDPRDRHIASVLAGVRRRHARPPRRKEALSADDLRAMLTTLRHDLRGLRDRAILLLGYAGGLRRSEIVALDWGPDQSDDLPDGAGWVEMFDDGVVLFVRGKTGWREVEIGCGEVERSCPVRALSRWRNFSRQDAGPVFRQISRDGARVLDRRLSDKHVARLVKRTAEEAGLRDDLAEAARRDLFSGHSLRAGLASHAEVEERFVQKQLGHASADMTRRYQRRRERFRVNLSKAAGL
jgi:integrase